MISARRAPSPKTVWVLSFHRLQARQSRAASRTETSVGRSGMRSAADFGFFAEGICAGHLEVAPEPVRSGALHGTAAQRTAEPALIHLQEIDHRRLIPNGPRLPGRITRYRGGVVPGADLLA